MKLGFKCAKIKGDSQLIINQLEGEYAVKAPNLLPLYLEAKQLLTQFESYQMEWIPRSQNSRADAAAGEILNASRTPAIALPDNLPLAEPREGIRGKIEKLNKQGEKASFKEVLALKSGNDTFSKLRGDALAAAVPVEVKEAIISQLRSGEEADFVAKTYRWWLRGLTVALSLRKVRVDAEVAANIVRKRG